MDGGLAIPSSTMTTGRPASFGGRPAGTAAVGRSIRPSPPPQAARSTPSSSTAHGSRGRPSATTRPPRARLERRADLVGDDDVERQAQPPGDDRGHRDASARDPEDDAALEPADVRQGIGEALCPVEPITEWGTEHGSDQRQITGRLRWQPRAKTPVG